MSLQYFKKEGRDEVDFFAAVKHQSFLQVDFNTLSIKVSYKVILSLLSDCNWIRSHNRLVQKRTFNHLAELASFAKCLSVRL